MKKSIRDRCVGYMDRAEEIKKYLEAKSSSGKSDKKRKDARAEGADK